MALPENVTRVWVRGTFTSTNGYPVTRPTSFSPNAPVLVDYAANEIIRNAGVTTVPDSTGAIAAQLIATDDPDLTPTKWNYRVVDSVGQKYNLTVPVNTPVLNSPGDPLDGQQYACVDPRLHQSSCGSWVRSTSPARSGWPSDIGGPPDG